MTLEIDRYEAGQPETTPLIGEWENKCNEFQRMILVRCIRPDRVIPTVTSYVPWHHWLLFGWLRALCAATTGDAWLTVLTTSRILAPV